MQNPSDNITYGGLEDSGLTVKVKDSANPKMKWQVWKKDRENPELENEAYTALKKMEFGEVFGVTFGEKDVSFVGKEGNQITYKQRTIYSVIPPVAEAQREPSQPNPLYNKPKEEPKNDKFWDMKAYKQCLWNYWLEKVVVNPQVEWKDDVWRVFQEIEDDAKKRFFDFSEPSNLEIYGEAAQYSETKPTMQGVIGGAELPTIQVQEDTTEWDKTFNCEVCNAPGRTHGDGHECLDY